MKTTLIRFHTSDNLRLDGLLYEPDTETKKVIIHIHGTASDFYRTRYIETFSKVFTDNGYAFLTFNNRGSGLGYNFYKEKDGKKIGSVQIGSEREIFEDCSLDIKGAIDFIKSKGYDEIVLQGHSYGCNKVVWYAQNDKFDGKLILLAPCDICDPKKFEHKKARNGETLDMFRYRNNTINENVAKLRNATFAQIGTIDEYISQKDKRDCIETLKKTFQNFVGKLVDGGNHNFDGKYQETAQNTIEWLGAIADFREFWNNVHTDWSKKHIANGKIKQDNWLDKYLPLIPKNEQVLELGCGIGNNVQYLTEKGFNVLASDFSSVALETIKDLMPQVKTQFVDLQKPLPFADKSFSVIIADLCLHYFSEQKTKEIMLEIKRILKPNGYLFARVNSVNDFNSGAGQGEMIEPNYYFVERNNKRFFDLKEIHKYFDLIGKTQAKETDMLRYTKPKKAFEICCQKV